MIKYSVRKPFTVLVAVVMTLLLGFVSVTRMTTDLLPPMSLPYLMVVTAYPGANPERVEHDVIKPLESDLGTITGVKNVYSTSSENFGIVQLEFEEETNMDSAMVKVSSALQEASPRLPESCSTPSIIELTPDMMATIYVSVSREGLDIYGLSNFVSGTLQPYIERQDGVASVSSVGMVEKSIQVELDHRKIDDLNAKLLETISEKMAEAKKELDEAQAKVDQGKKELEQAQNSFGTSMSGQIFDKISGNAEGAAASMKKQVDSLLEQIRLLQKEITDGETGQALDRIEQELAAISALLEQENLTLPQILELAGRISVVMGNLQTILEQLEKAPSTPMEVEQIRRLVEAVRQAIEKLSQSLDSVPQIFDGLETMFAQLSQAQLSAALGFASAGNELAGAEMQLANARAQYEATREEALANANLNSLLNVETLSQLIYAQNFSMPAGYIDDRSDGSWLLKVGEEYHSAQDIADVLLVRMDGIGEVHLKDVASVTVIDNAGQSYARLNGENAIILSVFKSSTAGTNEVAENCISAFEELEEKYPGTSLVPLVNQGDYITMIIDSVLSSMVIGAALAILILALFLKDFKPTLVVAISIPLSVLFALVLMYFTGLSVNMMSLSGLALGIGMLVDNSIVVIENIYRLRSRGIGAARAAVQGTKQVAGAIISSTLTTVCVFLPLVFTTGMIRDLMMPLGLCVGYCLTASLVVAMTVVPAASSTILKNSVQKRHPLFEKVQDLYGSALSWCLRHKALPLALAAGLLIFTVWSAVSTGITLIPEMTGNQIQVTVSTPEDMTREESYAQTDRVIDRILRIDGVESVGVMDMGSGASLMGAQTAGDKYGTYSCMIVAKKDTPISKIKKITQTINEEEFEVSVTASAGGMSDMTAMLGSGLAIKIYGPELDVLESLSQELAAIVEAHEGYTNVTTSFTDGEQAIHLVIDKDEAMSRGLTVAQVYMEIASRLSTSKTSTSITLDGVSMDITVSDTSDPLTVENLMDMEFEGSVMDENGQPVKSMHKLRQFATRETASSISSISRENQTRYVTVSAEIAEGRNATLLARTLSSDVEKFSTSPDFPSGYLVDLGGESAAVNDMVSQMLLLSLLSAVFVYLVMVAQFQSLLSPFIVLFTVPLAFTGGMFGLMLYGQPLSMMSLMGFVVLMGTVVNNGIVFVDYTNQLRVGGMDRRAALIATGKTRMRPILMTTLTTVLAMFQMIFSDDMAGQMGGGMSVVIVGGLSYATLMTLFIVPIIYDLFFRRAPLVIDVGSDNLDDIPDDAAEFIAQDLARLESGHSAPCSSENP